MSRTNKIYKNYFGSKNGSGVYQQIINQIRPHSIYMELFAGSGAIVQAKKPAPVQNRINDVDVKVFQTWRSSTIEISNCVISNMDAVEFLKNYTFNQFEKYCIYLDPPYPLSSRRSDRLVYNSEMTDQQHIELLSIVKELVLDFDNIDFLISTYENEIYSQALQDWNLHTFQAQTRRGPATECLYMNYTNDAGLLHQYDYLGNDFTDRQRIKRKVNREVSKLKNLPPVERNAIISAIMDLA